MTMIQKNLPRPILIFKGIFLKFFSCSDPVLIYLNFKDMLMHCISYRIKKFFSIILSYVFPSLKDRCCNQQSFAGVLFLLSVTRAALEVCLQWVQMQREGLLISGNVWISWAIGTHWGWTVYLWWKSFSGIQRGFI